MASTTRATPSPVPTQLTAPTSPHKTPRSGAGITTCPHSCPCAAEPTSSCPACAPSVTSQRTRTHDNPCATNHPRGLKHMTHNDDSAHASVRKLPAAGQDPAKAQFVGPPARPAPLWQQLYDKLAQGVDHRIGWY